MYSVEYIKNKRCAREIGTWQSVSNSLRSMQVGAKLFQVFIGQAIPKTFMVSGHLHFWNEVAQTIYNYNHSYAIVSKNRPLQGHDPCQDILKTRNPFILRYFEPQHHESTSFVSNLICLLGGNNAPHSKGKNKTPKTAVALGM